MFDFFDIFFKQRDDFHNPHLASRIDDRKRRHQARLAGRHRPGFFGTKCNKMRCRRKSRNRR